MELHRLATGRDSRVVTALSLLKSHLFKYQGQVSAALVLGGYDCNGPHLFTVRAPGPERERDSEGDTWAKSLVGLFQPGLVGGVVVVRVVGSRRGAPGRGRRTPPGRGWRRTPSRRTKPHSTRTLALASSLSNATHRAASPPPHVALTRLNNVLAVVRPTASSVSTVAAAMALDDNATGFQFGASSAGWRGVRVDRRAYPHGDGCATGSVITSRRGDGVRKIRVEATARAP